ncbi:putative Dephospho CoA kinase [Trypanosoma vivax]|nr:putative dephospho-CoA kinase [Trypanosoma vivax]KAH8619735.1 putative Dephospho CoA kinase [Trypanosoma vivax]
MLLVGLTGGIACGKSTVSTLLQGRHNTIVVDSDRIVRDLQRPCMSCTLKIARRWPNCVDAKTGEINRAALGSVIFSDPAARRELGRIMNTPIFLATMKVLIKLWWRSVWSQAKGESALMVVLDAPLLYESSIYTWFVDCVVVVSCTEEKQIARMKARNNLTTEQALQRVRSQMPVSEKCKLADFVLQNDGSLDELERLVDKSVNWMRAQRGGRMTKYIALVVLGTVAVAVSSAYIARQLLSSVF